MHLRFDFRVVTLVDDLSRVRGVLRVIQSMRPTFCLRRVPRRGIDRGLGFGGSTAKERVCLSSSCLPSPVESSVPHDEVGRGWTALAYFRADCGNAVSPPYTRPAKI